MKVKIKHLICLTGLGLLLSFLLPVNVSAAVFGPDSWEQYRLNKTNNPVHGGSVDEAIRKKYPTDNQLRATPVVVNDTLYIGNHNTGSLQAFNVKSGERLWKSSAPNWVHSEMIYKDGVLFVGYGNRYYQENGNRGTGESGVLAVDAETGETVWKFDTNGEVMPTPAIHGDHVYITAGDEQLYGVNRESGELDWQFDLGSIVSMSSPVIEGDTLYVGGGGSAEQFHFNAINLANQERKWETEFDQVAAGLDDVPPVVSETSIYTTALVKAEGDNMYEHMLYEMDKETGEITHKESLGTGEHVKNNKSGAPVLQDGTIFVGSPITQKFYAFDTEAKEMKWEYEGGVNKAPPVAYNEYVYFGNAAGDVFTFEAESGELVNQMKLGGTLAPAGAIIMNEHYISGSQDGNVYIQPLKDIRTLSESELYTGEKSEEFTEVSSDQENAGDSTSSSEGSEESSNSNTTLIIILVVLALVIFLGIYWYRKNSEKKNSQPK
ncbi:outer membrane protein assembly factor BamB family protein [Halobacillus sp. B29]|uniref:outer membrane protein assembly factor BamB family protein n=1 Tax=Halobacillus sp. B29 TaxID=3457432 RepID=UPI003FCD5871